MNKRPEKLSIRARSVIKLDKKFDKKYKKFFIRAKAPKKLFLRIKTVKKLSIRTKVGTKDVAIKIISNKFGINSLGTKMVVRSQTFRFFDK